MLRAGCDDDDARYPQLPTWHLLRWRSLDGSKFADAGILKDWLEALACDFDRAERIAETEQAGRSGGAPPAPASDPV